MLDDFRAPGVKFRSLTEHIDTDTPTGRAMWRMIGLLAELERSLISERTRAGVQAAQRRGREVRTQAQTDAAADRTRPRTDRQGRRPPSGRRPLQCEPHHPLPGACLKKRGSMKFKERTLTQIANMICGNL